MVIHDRGQGFVPTHAQVFSGLEGMRERVEFLEGSFEVEAAPGSGVHITAAFTLDPEPAARTIADLTEAYPAQKRST